MVPVSRYAHGNAVLKTGAFLILFLATVVQGISQNCSFDDCASDDCGSLNVKFTPLGGPVFCDGESIVFQNSSDTGFTYFVVDWRDGTQDTLFDHSDFSHVYNLPDSVLCKGGDVLFHSVCFKGVRICPAGETCQSGTYSVGIRKKPKALFGSGDVCLGQGYGFVNSSCHAYTSEWEFGDGNGSYDKDPTNFYDSLGNYVVRLIVTNACGADTTYGGVAVVLNPEAGFNRLNGFEAYCDSLPVEEVFTDASNAFTTSIKWTITPQDSTKWVFSDSLMTPWSKQIGVTFLDTGRYVIQLTASNDCGASVVLDTIDILLPPEVAIASPPETCDSVVVTAQKLGFTYEGPIDSCVWYFDKALPESRVGFSFAPVTFYGPGSIHLTVYGPCGILNFEVPVVVPLTPEISFPGVPAAYCFNAPPIQLDAWPSGGIWTGIGPTAGSITPEGVLDPSGLQPGVHLFYYQLDSIQCPTQATVAIDILDEPSVFLNAVPPACGSFVYTPEVVYQGSITTYQWSFTGGIPLVSNKAKPANIYFGNPGKYPVFIQATGACGSAMDSIHIDILPLLNLNIQPVPPAICANMPPFELKANYPGGTWSGPGIINSNTGLFDPGAVPGQTVTIVYSLLDGICENTDTLTFFVSIPEEVQVDDRYLCLNDSPTLLQADQPGGVWSGPGIINPQFGLFDPGTVGVGNWVVHYSWQDPQGCTSADSASIIVEAPPVIQLQDTTLLCFVPQEIDLVLATGLTVSPSGGSLTWSGPGVDPLTGTFNPVKAGLPTGTYTMTVSYVRNGCAVSAKAVITLIQLPPMVMPADQVVCISDSLLTLVATPPEGIWSGPGVDPQAGVIDLWTAGGGLHLYTYTLDPGISCDQSAQVQIEVVDPAEVVVTGPDLRQCASTDLLTLDGFSPAGGVWTGPGIIDPITGTIDLSQLPSDSTYTYQYCLESQAFPGCISCRSRQLTIDPLPEIDFGFAGYPCVNTLFTILDSSVHAVDYFWEFGDGFTSTDKNPQHTYTDAGDYWMSLIVTSQQGCRDTFVQNFSVIFPPVAGFDLVLDEGCAPFPVEVISTSGGDNISELWIVQGDTLFGKDPGIFLIDDITSDSVFTVMQQVTNICGTEIWEEDVLVHPYPVVDFGINVSEGCSPLTIQFSNISLGNAGDFVWDLGNGSVIEEIEPPVQVYTTADSTITTYPVTLISTNECGSDTLTKWITVYPPDVRAFIELDSLAGCQPLVVHPEDYSTPGAVTSWKVFDPSGGLLYATTEKSPEFILNEVGWHTIILYAANCGEDTDTVNVLVQPSPDMSFTHLPYACVGELITFLNTSQGAAGQTWDFGDGQQSTKISPSHVFTSPGIYTITLTGYSSQNNCPATTTSTVEIRDQPVADFQPSTYTGCSPLTVSFINGSSGPGNLGYIWTFGDGSSAEFSSDPEHVFSQPGSYVVSLQAYDANGCYSDTVQVVVQVYPSPKGGIGLPPGPICLGTEVVTFNNDYPDAVSFNWTINGQVFSTQNAEWSPPAIGNYSVSLVVGNIHQCRDTTETTVDVLPPPEAGFLPDRTSGCEDLVVQFANTSHDGDAWLWSFGEGSTSIDKDPEFSYTNPGSYQATLIAYAANGCPADTAVVDITVHSTPVADFSLQKDRLCGVPQEVQFTNLTDQADAWTWQFGPNTTAIQKDPLYTFTEPGIYPIKLIASTTKQCRDTVIREVEILGQPIADFDIGPGSGCAPWTLPLVNLSVDALSYTWEVEGLGDFNTVTPILTFSQPGIYSIKLIARYTDQCLDTLDLQDILQVYQGPAAGFTADINGNENIIGDVILTNLSQWSDRYLWDLGDGTLDTATHIVHEYDLNRSIQVILVAFNDNGGAFTCTDTAVQFIDPEWITTFYAPNAMTPGYGEEGTRVFRPVGMGIAEYEIAIYSPWGELVWGSTQLVDNQPVDFWDGTYRGEDVPQGAYAWLARLRFINGVTRVVKGTVTVLR